MRRPISTFAIMAFLLVSNVLADTLDRVRDTGVFKIGYREDAAPYSYKSALGEPAGYSVNLCRAVALTLKQDLDLADIALEYVPVTAENRFDAIKDGSIDILCGATTATLSRREHVDFSLSTFVDGASVLFLADGPGSFEELAGKKVGVRGGTTTEKGLGRTLEKLSIEAEVVPVKSHNDGLKMLEQGEISAYFGDRAILMFLTFNSKSSDKLRLAEDYFSYEPYALGLARGDDGFRLVVDKTLSRMFRSGDIEKVYINAFGEIPPTDVIRALYLINALPE